ncbi:unnamed protein product [Chondrus crispus]|uniref:Uncharacterized protein n=1 Tax=Chondrus crispus TaxID=2769 RepID=R7QCQ1_CHOCR|nr:unnamed protein product [Chondrus crispus]CDF36287.1 unnamed protein product [Chondrus crispus]|eukprot:XP_005716106.1 unnamed protein product [Chondrus crispus]
MASRRSKRLPRRLMLSLRKLAWPCRRLPCVPLWIRKLLPSSILQSHPRRMKTARTN